MAVADEGVRLAIVGCGAVAEVHAAAISRLKGVICGCLYDRAPERAEALRLGAGLSAAVVKDLQEVPRHADAAIVAVPNALHAAVSIELLRMGLHVLCEKPLATSVADAERMVRIALEHQRLLACGLVRRFSGSRQLVFEMVGRQLLGDMLSVHVRESIDWYWSRAAFDKGSSGGGVLIDTGPHVFDLLQELLGPPDLLEYADDSCGGVEGCARVRLLAESSSRKIPIEALLTRGGPAPSRTRIECEQGWIELDPRDHDRVSVFLRGAQRPYIVTTRHPGENPYVEQLRHFCAAVDRREKLTIPAAEALPGIRLIEACYSIRQSLQEPWSLPDRPTIEVRRSSWRRILVTGAAGRIGSRLVERWAEHGQVAKLRCLIRGYRSAERVMRFPVEIAEADLCDARLVRKAMEGCDAVIHLAAGERPGAETEAVTQAALALGVRRFIHMSTACVYGLGLPASVEDQQEDTPIRSTGELYADGKAAAERVVRDGVRAGLHGVVLRPHVVYGPGMRWSAELMRLLGSGQLCVLSDGGICNVVYVDDLIDAIDCALEADSRPGATCFITDGRPLMWAEYVGAHARLSGIEPAVRSREEMIPQTRGLRGDIRESARLFSALLRTPEFRAFITDSRLTRATLFRLYLFLRSYPRARGVLDRLKGGSGVLPPVQEPRFDKHWILLQLSQARLSPKRTEQEINFTARVDFDEGLRRTAIWFERYGLLSRPAIELPSKGAG